MEYSSFTIPWLLPRNIIYVWYTAYCISPLSASSAPASNSLYILSPSSRALPAKAIKLVLYRSKTVSPYAINLYTYYTCRVDADLQVKVADFGLTRDIYATDYYRQSHQGRVPIKWMSLESLHDKISNEKTDVVSFFAFIPRHWAQK